MTWINVPPKVHMFKALSLRGTIEMWDLMRGPWISRGVYLIGVEESSPFVLTPLLVLC